MKLYEIQTKQREPQIIATFGDDEYQKYEQWFKQATARNKTYTVIEQVDGADGQSYDILVDYDYSPAEPDVGINYPDVDYTIIAHGYSDDKGTLFIKEGEVELSDESCGEVKDNLIQHHEEKWDDPRI